jgi:RNA polymerase sigma-70 factor, ECF subfamily
LDDADLVKRIGAGDRAAMKLLYERHSNGLFHFIRASLKDPFEAADVMQEVFLEIWRAASGFQGRSAAKTWIFGIARHKAFDRMRRGGRVVLSDPDPTLPDEAPNPEAVAAAASDAARVRECIERLSPAHRSSIHLAFYGEMSYGEIADVEGVPVGTIKTRIMHAKRLMMRCLASFSMEFYEANS